MVGTADAAQRPIAITTVPVVVQSANLWIRSRLMNHVSFSAKETNTKASVRWRKPEAGHLGRLSLSTPGVAIAGYRHTPLLRSLNLRKSRTCWLEELYGLYRVSRG
jgi:hypothetical protein